MEDLCLGIFALALFAGAWLMARWMGQLQHTPRSTQERGYAEYARITGGGVPPSDCGSTHCPF